MSPKSSSLCCCSRYFRRSPPAQSVPPSNERGPIEIKVNGFSHLTVPRVAINGVRQGDGLPESFPEGFPENLPVNTASPIGEDVFETARTSRVAVDRKHFAMTELMRMVRIEEGLEVTPRVVPVDQEIPEAPIPEKDQNERTLKPQKRSTHPRKAVFNDDGDITARSVATIKIPPPRNPSSGSIEVPVITISSSKSLTVTTSPISRRITATPQIVNALVTFMYASLTSILTSFTRFVKF